MEFVRWLERGAVHGGVKDIPFAVFGLGNSCYTKFCGAAVSMDKLAEAAGGIRLLEAYKVTTQPLDPRHAGLVGSSGLTLTRLRTRIGHK